MEQKNKTENHYLSLVIQSKFIKRFAILDHQITSNLTTAGIETRSVKSNGLWCCVLLPAVLCMYALFYQVSTLYKVMACISVGLFVYSILFILFTSVSCVVLTEPAYGGCTASALISVLMVYVFLDQDLFFSLICSLPAIFMYNTLLRVCLVSHPKTFTVGEAMIVSQVLSLSAIAIAITLFKDIGEHDEDTDFINTIVNTVLSTVGLIVTALYLLGDEQRNLESLIKIFIVAFIYAMLVLHSIIGVGFLPKIFHYIFLVKNRTQIFMFWLALVAAAVLVLTLRTQMAVKANTVTRKSFHVLASLVFMSGIVLDVNLIRLASGIGISLVILLEALRKSNIEPISSALQSAFEVYSDEKDSGSFAMTPLYLFWGLASPLALVPARGAPLERLAGVLAVGVGDAAASWAGASYGFYKWRPDNNRTLEGTAFNILSQIGTVYALELFELVESRNALARTGVAALATGLLEAHTRQVDNLVLPLAALLAMQLTAPLA